MEKHFLMLEELIKDDDEIVTVASFAYKAQVSIEESQKILEKFAEINKGSKKLSITYILNGRKYGEHQLSVSLVKDNVYEEEKKLFQDQVHQIIFSIQKAKNIDFNVLALVDPIITSTENLIVGAIVGQNCIKRKLRKKLLPVLPPATVKGKSTIFTKQNSAVKSENQKVKSNGNTNNKITVGNAQSNIATLFSKTAQNKKTEPKVTKQHEIKKQKSNGGLQNFFAKKSNSEVQKDDKKDIKILTEPQLASNIMDQNNADSDTDDEIIKDLEIKEEKLHKADEKKESMNHSKKQEKRSDLFDTDSDDDTQKHPEIKKEKPLQKNTPKKNASTQKKKRGRNDVGNDKAAKKRKRIIVKDDSDSDDIFGCEKSDNEDLIEKSDEEPEPVKVDKKPLAPLNKRKKAVDKIYEDEDGYIVTVTEYQTASEDENEPENKIVKVQEQPKIKKEESANPETDISSNKNTKNKKGGIKKVPSSGSQPTLMNFFKKK